MWSTIRRKPLFFILLGAFALRAVTAVALQQWIDTEPNRTFLIEGDANGYWELGRKIAQGRPDALSTLPNTRDVLRMPGFPALLGLSIAVAGESFLFARILLAAVGTVACGLVYCLGKELFDKTIGLMAAGIAAILPTFVGFSVVILSETLFAATLLAGLLFMAKLTKTSFATETRRRGIRLSLTVGLIVAAACYVRPSWLLAGPLFGLIYLTAADNKKQAALRSSLILTALFLALLPWAYRNHQVTEHWIFTTLWAGPSLYDGLNPLATGESDMTFYETDRLSETGMTEYEIDQHYRQKAWQFVVENPGRTAELAWIKLLRFWKPWPNAEQFQNIGYCLGVALFFIPMIMFAIFGLWTHSNRMWICLLTSGPIFYFTLIHMIFVGSLRYRLPAEYPLCVLSAAGISRSLSAISSFLSARRKAS
ncbi:MAG: glycosyltransferase family 39 protein [Planctomycetes bacterium]|nr:glycosyltransferase family 39 protein [Planctomycetota bacterium]